MVNPDEIEELINQYFESSDGASTVEITVGDDGRVNIDEVTPGYGVFYASRESMPNGRLPFSFGRCNASLLLDSCGLETLEGCPEIVNGRFTANYNPLHDLKGAPRIVGERIAVRQANPLKSLEGFPDQVGKHVSLNYHPQLPLLRTLNCRAGVLLFGSVSELAALKEVEDIINKYAGQGREGAFDCRRELRAAGFEGNARW